MTYSSGNLISASDYIVFRGTYGPNQPYQSNSNIETVSAIIGVGYGNVGYGQTSTFLPQKNIGDHVGSIEWNALQLAMSNINIHSGSFLQLQPTVDINEQIIVENGSNTTANISALVSTLYENRMQYDQTQMVTNAVISSTRVNEWNSVVEHEFTVDFGSEDKARYFFNTGGQIQISANRTNGSANTLLYTNEFESPSTYPVTNTYWSTFINQYGVWIDPDQNYSAPSDQTQNYYRNFYANYTGAYTFTYQASGNINIYVDEALVGQQSNPFGNPNQTAIILEIGNHIVRFEVSNATTSMINPTWIQNQSAWAATITDNTNTIVFDTHSAEADELIESQIFNSPPVVNVTSDTWSTFMNNNAVSIDPNSYGITDLTNFKSIIHRLIVVPVTGTYTFTYAVDSSMNVYIDNALYLTADVLTSRSYNVPGIATFSLSAGTHVIRVDTEYEPDIGGWAITVADSNGNNIWRTRDDAAYTIPNPYGPNQYIDTNPINSKITNMLRNTGNVIISANTTSLEGIGDTYGIGYYNMPQSYASLFTTFDQSQTYSNAAVLLQSFTSPNVGYSYIVPDAVTAMQFKLWGAGGSGVQSISNNTLAYAGGAGSYISATLPVTPGETLIVVVGGGGLPGTSNKSVDQSIGGGGGGYTAIYRGRTPLLIASGGGGSSSNTSSSNSGKGGAGGIATGSSSTLGNTSQNATGGTQTAGGVAGSGNIVSGNDGLFLGGANANPKISLNNGGINGGGSGGYYGSGGGGAGYFGGGSGGAIQSNVNTSGGGAGGSCYVDPTATNVLSAVSSDWYSAPAQTDPDYIIGFAQGNVNEGGPGLAVLYSVASTVPMNASNWIVKARTENVGNINGGNGSLLRFISTINAELPVDGITTSNVDIQRASGVVSINQPNVNTIIGFDYTVPDVTSDPNYIQKQMQTNLYFSDGIRWSGNPITSNLNLVPIYNNWNNHIEMSNYLGLSNSLNPQYSCLQYSAYLEVPMSGTWTFSIEHSHDVWVWIEQSLMLYKTGAGIDTFSIQMGIGQVYSFQVNTTFDDTIYPRKIIARWQAPNMNVPTIIPADAFYYNKVKPPFINLPPYMTK